MPRSRKKGLRWPAVLVLAAAGIVLVVSCVFLWGYLSVMGLAAAPLTLSFSGAISDGGSVTLAYQQTMWWAFIAGLILLVLGIGGYRRRWKGTAWKVIAIALFVIAIVWAGWFSGWTWAVG